MVIGLLLLARWQGIAYTLMALTMSDQLPPNEGASGASSEPRTGSPD